MIEYIAFYAAINHSTENEKYLIDCLKSYDIGSYLIVREVAENAHKLTNGEHYHFLVQMNNDDYTRFRKRVFLDHFKLKGRATKNQSRQYGKVNYLKDPDRMAVYMMKDNNVVESTFTEGQLESWYQQSFKKSEQRTYKDELTNYVKEHLEVNWHKDEEYDIFCKICELQVKFNRWIAVVSREEHCLGGMKNSLTRAQLINYSVWYMTYKMYHMISTEKWGYPLITDRNLTNFILNMNK